MKRAIELLGTGYVDCFEVGRDGEMGYVLDEAQLEALVRRAREETRDVCALEADRMDVDVYELKGGGSFAAQSARPADEIAASIRALALTAQPDGTEKGPNR